MNSQAVTRFDSIPLFHEAEPDVLAKFSRFMIWKTADEGEVVLDYEDDTTDVFFIAQGAVRVIVRTPSGREVIFGDLKEGAFFGEMAAIDEQPRSANVTALYKSRIGILPGKRFLEIIFASPIVCHRLMRILTDRVRGGNARLLELAVLPIKLRLYRELIRLGRRRPNSDEIIISPPPLQHELAARIGARREAVSRELSKLARDGAISKSRRSIVIHHPDRLENEVLLFLEHDSD